MIRLIGADELHFDLVLDGAGHEIRFVEAKNIHEAPTIDAVPVVRCKDCEYAYINSFSMASGVVLCRHWTNYADGIRTIMQQDDYCSYGERRE